MEHMKKTEETEDSLACFRLSSFSVCSVVLFAPL